MPLFNHILVLKEHSDLMRFDKVETPNINQHVHSFLMLGRYLPHQIALETAVSTH